MIREFLSRQDIPTIYMIEVAVDEKYSVKYESYLKALAYKSIALGRSDITSCLILAELNTTSHPPPRTQFSCTGL